MSAVAGGYGETGKHTEQTETAGEHFDTVDSWNPGRLGEPAPPQENRWAADGFDELTAGEAQGRTTH
jgi:hypothetical protein